MGCLLVTGEAKNPLGKPIAMDASIGVGFGDAIVYRDGEEVFDGEQWARDNGDNFNYKPLSEVEEKAAQEPDRHWVLWLYAPLWSAVYVRTSEKLWQCAYAGMGFADDENAEKDRDALEQILKGKVINVPDPASSLSDSLPAIEDVAEDVV